MRIAQPARKHGVADADIRHGIRNAIRRVAIADDLTMLIGPATDGALLEVGVLDLDGTIPSRFMPCGCDRSSTGFCEEVTTMRHSDHEIERAAERFEQLAEELDPDAARVHHTDDLREIAVVSEAVQTGEARLREAVEIARARGRSWNQIAVALGVSRQAARQRFSGKVHT